MGVAAAGPYERSYIIADLRVAPAGTREADPGDGDGSRDRGPRNAEVPRGGASGDRVRRCQDAKPELFGAAPWNDWVIPLPLSTDRGENVQDGGRCDGTQSSGGHDFHPASAG